MPDTISAKPLFDTFKKRGDKAAFARKLNISIQVLMNWEERGIPPKEVRAVAHAMNLPSVDHYYLLAEGGQKQAPKSNGAESRNIAHSQADKLLALVKTFLDTDSEIQTQILEAAKALEKHGTTETATHRKRTKRR